MEKVFNDEKLQKLVLDNEKCVKEHLKILDKISNDIKNLESFLSKSGIPQFLMKPIEGEKNVLGWA